MDHFATSIGVARLIHDIDETKHQDFVVRGGGNAAGGTARAGSGVGGIAAGGIAQGGSGSVTIGDYYSHSLITEASSKSLRSQDHELERITRQVVQEIKDSELFVSILQEVQEQTSEGYPPSVKAALGSCISRQEMVKQYRKELAAVENEREEKSIIKEYQKSFLEASKAFGQSVLLFRELVIG